MSAETQKHGPMRTLIDNLVDRVQKWRIKQIPVPPELTALYLSQVREALSDLASMEPNPPQPKHDQYGFTIPGPNYDTYRFRIEVNGDILWKTLDKEIITINIGGISINRPPSLEGGERPQSGFTMGLDALNGYYGVMARNIGYRWEPVKLNQQAQKS